MPIKFLNEEKGKIIGRGVVDCVIELAALHCPAVNLAKSVVQTGRALHIAELQKLRHIKRYRTNDWQSTRSA